MFPEANMRDRPAAEMRLLPILPVQKALDRENPD